MRSKNKDDVKAASQQSRLDSMIKAAVQLGADKGQKCITEQAGLIFDEQHGSIEAIKAERDEAKRLYEEAICDSKVSRKTVNDLPAYVPVMQAHDNSAASMFDFASWRGQDLIQLVLFGTLTLLCMALSVVNVQVNIMASQELVFIESPWKSWVIAMLAPAAATSIKMLPHIFASVSWQDKCKKVIYGLTALMSFIWIVQFSQTFDGIGAQPSLSDLLNEQGSSDYFVLVQLLAEVMIAATLFIAVQNLLDAYNPSTLKANPSRLIASEQLRIDKSACDKAFKTYQDADNKLVAHKAARQAFINEQLSAFAIALARHQALFN